MKGLVPASGQRQTWRLKFVVSACPLKADIGEHAPHVGFGPIRDTSAKVNLNPLRINGAALGHRALYRLISHYDNACWQVHRFNQSQLCSFTLTEEQLSSTKKEWEDR
jgi:hypothetical protein